MELREVMQRLEAAGTAQNRKVYGRHGVAGEMFGVSYAELKKLQKAIGRDHALAGELWATGNHDARVLAMHVADPEAVRAAEADAWVRACADHVIASAVSALLARSPVGARRAGRWCASKKELVAACGWSVRAQLADGGDVDDAELAEWLDAVERGIHAAPNRARYSMNQALIGIGARGGSWTERAVAAAERIGPVEVDHGETGCQTPSAAAYIRKVVAHREELAARRAAKAGAKRKAAGKKKAVRGAGGTGAARKGAKKKAAGKAASRRKAARRG